MAKRSWDFRFKVLCETVEKKNLVVLLKLIKRGKPEPSLRIDIVDKEGNVIDYESVKPNESVDQAAARCLNRLPKPG